MKMKYRGYMSSVEFDPDDNILVGRVLDIDDVISFHGESIAEFTEAFHEAEDDYVSACEKMGQTPEKPASGRLMLRVDPVAPLFTRPRSRLQRTPVKALTDGLSGCRDKLPMLDTAL